MTITFRHYTYPHDYQRVSDFLIRHHCPGNKDGNWLEPAWEYMHFHPALDDSSLEKIGLWEDGGEIVAVAHYESSLGEAFFQFHPEYRRLSAEMLDYAEQNFSAPAENGGAKLLHAYINDDDPAFQKLAEQRGFRKASGDRRPMAQFDIPDPFPAIYLPAGFNLVSLADECDWAKVHRVMWRGFNHEGEPPSGPGELESRQRMFDTPRARRELKIAVAAPNGDFVSFCGMFYEPANQYGYVEPVATDPNYRRLGLGKAAVLEGIRRCGLLGATTAYVGSEQAFYLALGFRVIFTSECWVKEIS